MSIKINGSIIHVGMSTIGTYTDLQKKYWKANLRSVRSTHGYSNIKYVIKVNGTQEINPAVLVDFADNFNHHFGGRIEKTAVKNGFRYYEVTVYTD